MEVWNVWKDGSKGCAHEQTRGFEFLLDTRSVNDDFSFRAIRHEFPWVL